MTSQSVYRECLPPWPQPRHAWLPSACPVPAGCRTFLPHYLLPLTRLHSAQETHNNKYHELISYQWPAPFNRQTRASSSIQTLSIYPHPSPCTNKFIFQLLFIPVSGFSSVPATPQLHIPILPQVFIHEFHRGLLVTQPRDGPQPSLTMPSDTHTTQHHWRKCVYCLKVCAASVGSGQ